ncbi:hypothetical protein EDD17DRAFT_1511678 [Pisolithus thermaeus]|nr:hypothetical protein EDD17DRAFT_1511678 [Pisolithus thermaeus]
MARDLIETVHRTMGSHVVMFIAHEAGEGQIKMAVFKTAPGDGKKAFIESSEASKDWVLNGENILMDYLLTAPVEEDSAEKQEVEISLDEDGNPQMPTWAGQKLKVQQNLVRAVFQAAYVWDIAKFTKKPKAKVPWGLLIKSPMEYIDSQSIPEGFTMKDPSKWTKADLGMLWGHWGTLEAEEKRRENGWTLRMTVKRKYQVLVDLVEGLPEEVRMWKGERGRPSPLGHMGLGCQVFAPGNSFGWGEFWKALGQLQSTRFASSSSGWEVVLGLGLLLRECSCARKLKRMIPWRAEDVMDIVGLIVSRLEQSSAGMKEPKKEGEGAVTGGGDREDEEKEKEEAPAVLPTQKRKGAESGMVTRRKNVAKKDGERGRRMEKMG